MTFPKNPTGRRYRAKVGGRLLSAGSAAWDDNTGPPYRGIIRHKGAPVFQLFCQHDHPTTQDARDCAADELARRAGEPS